MSAIVEAVSDVFEAVGDAVGSVVEAIDDGLHWIDDKIIQPVAKTVEKTIDAAMDDPLGTIAKVATAVFAPQLLPLVNGATTLANGGSFNDALKSAATAYVAPEVGKFVGASIAPEFGTEAARVAAGASASVTSSVIMGGKDPLGALISGGVSAAMPILTGEIPGYDSLPDAAKKSINSALAAELTGKDASQAAINSALASGINMANEYLRDEYDLEGGIPSGLIRSGSSGSSATGAKGSYASNQIDAMERGNVASGDAAAQGDESQPGIEDQMGPQQRSISDLSQDELAGLLGDMYQNQPSDASQDTSSQGADVQVGDIGFGGADFGGVDFGGDQFLSKPDFGGADFGGKDFGAKSDLSFGQAFAQARVAGDKTFDWNGKSYTTEMASSGSGKGYDSIGGGRGGQGGATAAELAKYFGGQAPAGFDSVGGGRGGQGGPTAQQLADYVAGKSTDLGSGASGLGSMSPEEMSKFFNIPSPETIGGGRGGQGGPTAEELAAGQPYVGYGQFRMNPKMGDINQVADPRTLAAAKGFLGQAPDEQGFSALHPDISGIRSAGEAGYYTGIGAQVAAPLAKGIGSAVKGIDSLVEGSQMAAYQRAVDEGLAAQKAAGAYADPLARLSSGSRQFPNMIVDMASDPSMAKTAQQAMDLYNSGDRAGAFKLIESNPVTNSAMQQFASGRGFQEISPYLQSQRLYDPAKYMSDMQGQFGNVSKWWLKNNAGN